jgi:hypothetical protein
MVWVVVVGLNSFALARTLSYVNRFSQETDLILHHYDPGAPRWLAFRELFKGDDVAPVLLSGFHDTPTPHIIADGLRSVPHLLGQTITAFWYSIDPPYSIPSEFRQFRHWLAPSQLAERIKDDPVSSWPKTYESLLARTRRAIVPVSGTYPAEWGEWPLLWGPRAWRFPNLCDVLDRTESAFVAQSKPSSAATDELGMFWLVDGVLKAQPRLQERAAAVIEVGYTGADPRIAIDGIDVPGRSRSIAASGEMIFVVNAVVGSTSAVEVFTSAETRLRSVGLYGLLSAAR